MQADSPQLLTRQDAAKLLSVSVRTVDGLIRTGDLPHVKVGKCVRFRAGALEQFVSDRESRVSPAAKQETEANQ